MKNKAQKQKSQQFYNTVFFTRENCDAFNFNIFNAKTMEEKIEAITAYIEVNKTLNEALENMLSENSIDDLAKWIKK